MAFTPFSAKNAKVRIGAGAATVTAKAWNVEPDADELDVSNFEGAGYSDVIAGLINARITIELDLDGQAGANIWDTPPTLRPGTTLSTVRLYVNDTTGPSWLFSSALVLASPNNMNVKEAAKATIRLRAKGSFSYPTGTMAP